jgi:hypothetical protein
MSDANHPNADRVRQALDAFAAEDWDRMNSHLDDHVVWHVGGDHPLAGTYRGRESVMSYMRAARALTGGTLRLEVGEVLANDDFGAVILRATAQRNGKQLDVQMAEAIRFGEDGRWAEFWALSDNQATVDEFWR